MNSCKNNFSTKIELLREFGDVRIAHPRIKQLFEELSVFLAPCSGANIVLLIGPPGVGKSTAIDVLLKRTYEEYSELMQEQPDFIPAVKIEAPSAGERAFSWRLLYGSLLEALNEPLVERKIDVEEDVAIRKGKRPWAESKTLSGLRLAVERSLKMRKTRFVVIDEAVHILRQAGPRELPVHMDTLKSLSNTCGVTFVLVGSYDLYEILELSGQLARRTHLVHFSRYSFKDPEDTLAYKNSTRTLFRYLPINEKIDPSPWLNLLMANTHGCIGIQKDILQRALTMALDNDGKWRDSFLKKNLLTKSQSQVILKEIIEGEQRIQDAIWHPHDNLAA